MLSPKNRGFKLEWSFDACSPLLKPALALKPATQTSLIQLPDSRDKLVVRKAPTTQTEVVSVGSLARVRDCSVTNRGPSQSVLQLDPLVPHSLEARNLIIPILDASPLVAADLLGLQHLQTTAGFGMMKMKSLRSLGSRRSVGSRRSPASVGMILMCAPSM